MKNRIDDTREYIDAAKIADKLLEAAINNSQDDDLNEFLCDEATRESLKERFNHSQEMHNLLTEILKQDRVADIGRMQTKIQKLRDNRKLNLRRRIVYMTSVAIALLFITFLIWNKEVPYEPKLITFVSKNVTVPTLFIEGGQTIDLRTDTIPEHTNFSKINNKLKYNVNPELPSKEEVIYNTLIVPVGYTYNVELSDGTSITVNAGGELKYPINFTGGSREVELKGEAYFEVSKHDKPFFVKVGTATVKVYGTQFNINHNEQLKFIETVLVEGSIGFKVEDKETILQPNECINYNCVSNELIVNKIEVENYVSWKDGIFKYKDENLLKVFNEISNWYGVKFNLKKDLGDVIVTIDINKDKSIDEIVAFISMILNTEIVKEERGIYSIE